jgi:phospho-N-acetylmuramoyl-pentapeptide-transferase
LGPIIIPFLKKLKFGQFVRDDGPQSHLKKTGTPTMGGLIIVFAFTVTSLIFAKDFGKVLPVVLVTFGFALVGFMDDYIKVVLKRSMGLRAWQKMLGQIVITGLFAFYILRYTDLGTSVMIPFIHTELNLGYSYVPVLFLIILGTVNGSNFTDGLDGLASSVTVIIAVFFAVTSIGMHTGISPVACAMIGSLLGFLVFNVYPAKVFMGDTGSLALGGFVAAAAYMQKMPIFIALIAFIYLMEVISVMIQVGYFKKTGKRVFKMAPIHHHFELSGWPETKVVAIFSIVTAILCVIALVSIV